MEFTPQEANLIRTALRWYLQKTEKGIDRLHKKFGKDAALENKIIRAEMLDELQRRFQDYLKTIE